MSVNAASFSRYWQTHFPNSYPVGHLLRAAYQPLWFRIHSLPESKRYPDTEAEYQEILRRHTTMLEELFPHVRELLLVAVAYSETSTPERVELPNIPSSSFTYVQGLPLHEIEQAEVAEFGHIWLHTLAWPYPFLADLLRAVAQWQSNDWLLLDPQLHRIYHPYDGGADMILETVAKQQHLKQKYTQWLSSHHLGL